MLVGMWGASAEYLGVFNPPLERELTTNASDTTRALRLELV